MVNQEHSENHKLVGLHIKSLSNLIRRTLDAGISASGVEDATGTQGMIIHFLFDRRGQNLYQRDIEAIFHIRRATATRTLQLMEQNGLIERETDPDDARLKRLILTPKAIEYHHHVHHSICECEALLTQDIPDEEVEQFLATLQKMKHNLEKA